MTLASARATASARSRKSKRPISGARSMRRPAPKCSRLWSMAWRASAPRTPPKGQSRECRLCGVRGSDARSASRRLQLSGPAARTLSDRARLVRWSREGAGLSGGRREFAATDVSRDALALPVSRRSDRGSPDRRPLGLRRHPQERPDLREGGRSRHQPAEPVQPPPTSLAPAPTARPSSALSGTFSQHWEKAFLRFISVTLRGQ